MNIKQVMSRYFKEYFDYWYDKYGTLPKVPWDEDISSLLYQSEPDEEGYVYWKPKLKDIHENFEYIEEILGINVNNSIKEYFNSYWFLNLEGFYNTKRISLEPVEPDKNVLEYFQNIKQYEESIGNSFRYIDIGFISPEDISIAVDNETGKIVKHDYETEEIEVIAESLDELIGQLKVRR